MRTAGSANTQTSVIPSVGRTSGRTFQTPCGNIIPTPAGSLLVALPSGTRAGSCARNNVPQAGSATVVSRGESFDVGQPIIAATARRSPTTSPRGRVKRFASSVSVNILRSAKLGLSDFSTAEAASFFSRSVGCVTGQSGPQDVACGVFVGLGVGDHTLDRRIPLG